MGTQLFWARKCNIQKYNPLSLLFRRVNFRQKLSVKGTWTPSPPRLLPGIFHNPILTCHLIHLKINSIYEQIGYDFLRDKIERTWQYVRHKQ